MKTRYSIAYKGLKEGSHTFEWKVGDDFWTTHADGGIIRGEANVAAVLEKGTTGVMRITVEIVGTVTVPCDRCLEDCNLPVNFRGELAVKVSEEASKEDLPFEGDILWLNPGDATIDLEQYIYESVVLALPLQRIHPEDVHGQPLCNPAMLQRFKIVSEEEFENMQKN
jgi:uncharacterized metal-binding protein YceD (DUF177 family)